MLGVEWLFWASLALGVYPYAIYPILVLALGVIAKRSVLADSSYRPVVTVVTAAFNEAAHIGATVRNKLEQRYPPGLLEVIVVSDGSEDGTDQIVQSIAADDPRVRLIRQEPRQGKTAALNLAVSQARGEIVVFADANSMYAVDCVERLTSSFADASVGYVTGHMLYVNPDGSLVGDGCSAYMRYENAIRSAETGIGSVVGVDGGVDAVRKVLYRNMRADQLPDFVLPLRVVKQGYRVIYESGAVLQEDTLASGTSEIHMRIRVALRAFWALADERSLLNPLRWGLFSWQLWSHKLLRYLSFIPLILAATLNWVLLGKGWVYTAGAVAQIVFVAFVLAAMLNLRWLGSWGPVRYCYYFALINYASAVALARFMRGQKQVLWQPRTG